MGKNSKVTLINIDEKVMESVNRIECIIFAEDDVRYTLNRQQDKLKQQIKEEWAILEEKEPGRQEPNDKIEDLQVQVDQIDAKKNALGKYLRTTLFGRKGNKKQETIVGLYASLLTVNGTPLYTTYEEAILKRSFKAYDEAIKTLITTWNTSENISDQTMGRFCKWVSRVSSGVQGATGHSNISKGKRIKKKAEKTFYADLFKTLVDSMDNGKLRNPDLISPKGETHEGVVKFEKDTLKVLYLEAVEKQDDEEA